MIPPLTRSQTQEQGAKSKTFGEIYIELRKVFYAYPEYSDPALGSGKFEDMVKRFSEDSFYKLHYEAIEYLNHK